MADLDGLLTLLDTMVAEGILRVPKRPGPRWGITHTGPLVASPQNKPKPST
jgi:hypothetical protein